MCESIVIYPSVIAEYMIFQKGFINSKNSDSLFLTSSNSLLLLLLYEFNSLSDCNVSKDIKKRTRDDSWIQIYLLLKENESYTSSNVPQNDQDKLLDLYYDEMISLLGTRGVCVYSLVILLFDYMSKCKCLGKKICLNGYLYKC